MNSVAVFGGGCFWCTEAVFKMLRGVTSVEPGYAGGKAENPTYYQVCNGDTGHAEVIKIEYDPSQVAYRDLLTVFLGPMTRRRSIAKAMMSARSIAPSSSIRTTLRKKKLKISSQS